MDVTGWWSSSDDGWEQEVGGFGADFEDQAKIERDEVEAMKWAAERRHRARQAVDATFNDVFVEAMRADRDLVELDLSDRLGLLDDDEGEGES
jgi:hypothetical protein